MPQQLRKVKEMPVLRPCTDSSMRLRLCNKTGDSHRWHIGLPDLAALHTTGNIPCTQNIPTGLRGWRSPLQSPRQRDCTFDHEGSPCHLLAVRVRLPTLSTELPKLRGLRSHLLVETAPTAKRAMQHSKCKQMPLSTTPCIGYMSCTGM